MAPCLDPSTRRGPFVAPHHGPGPVVGVGEVGRVVIGANIGVGENDPVSPLADVAPRVFNVPILDGGLAVCPRGAACVVGHGIGGPGVDLCAGAYVTLSDRRLAVPVRIFHDIQKPPRQM